MRRAALSSAELILQFLPSVPTVVVESDDEQVCVEDPMILPLEQNDDVDSHIPSYRDLFPLPDEPDGSELLSDTEWASATPAESLPSPVYPFDPLALRRSEDMIMAGGLTDFPPSARKILIHPSIILQLDGLLYSVLRLRIERDVMAQSLAQSLTEIFGLASFESCSSFGGFFLHDSDQIPSMVRAAQRHRAYGLFIIPFIPAAEWYKALYRASLLPAGLIFSLPHSIFGRDIPTVAIFSSFNRVTGARHRTRPERRVAIQVVPNFVSANGRLGPRPRVLHRVSPLAAARAPKKADDTATAVEPEADYVSMPPPDPMPSRWDAEAFARETVDFPFDDVRGLGLDVAGEGLSCYSGDISKSVAQPVRARLLNEDDAVACRVKLIEAKEAGKAIGPSPTPHFPSTKEVPPFTVPKDPHDPTSTRRRAVFNFSADPADGPSTNGLCYDPLLFRENVRPEHFRDELVWMFLLFKCVFCIAFDIPGCFELNRVHPTMLPLMAIPLRTQEHGLEYWLKLATSFGWSPSEWGWQVLLALILWRLRLIGYADVMAYVDNFYFLLPLASPTGHALRLQRFFRRMNVPLHEFQFGSVIRCLGWVFNFSDPSAPIMICPKDKWVSLMAHLDAIVGCKWLSLRQIHRATGIMMWLCAAFTIGRPSVAALVKIRTQGVGAQRARERRLRRPVPASTVKCEVDTRAAEAIRFWHKFFGSWDRICPVVLGFGPCATWQFLGRFDAATVDGHGGGGFIFSPTLPEVLAFSRPWSKDESDSARSPTRVSTTVVEGWAALIWFRLFGHLCARSRVLLESDSEPLVMALESAFSERPMVASCVREVRENVAKWYITLRVRHVLGAVFNEIADHLSHCRVELARCLVRNVFGLEMRLVSCDTMKL